MLNDKCEVYNYADDNTVSLCNKDPLIVKQTLEVMSNMSICWLRNNFMHVNPSKFQCMVLSRNNCDTDFNVDGVVVKNMDCVKLLGCHFDNELMFSTHIKQLIAKCNRQVNSLGRLSFMLDTETKFNIVILFITTAMSLILENGESPKTCSEKCIP